VRSEMEQTPPEQTVGMTVRQSDSPALGQSGTPAVDVGVHRCGVCIYLLANKLMFTFRAKINSVCGIGMPTPTLQNRGSDGQTDGRTDGRTDRRTDVDRRNNVFTFTSGFSLDASALSIDQRHVKLNMGTQSS